MKVAVISDYRSTLSARPEAEMFIGMARLGLDILVLTYPDADYIPAMEQAGIRVIPFHPQSKFDRGETARLRDILLREQPDILHLYNGKAILHGIRASRGLPVRLFLYRGFAGHVHWYDPTAYFKYLHPRVDRIICITREIQAGLQRQMWLGKDTTVWIPKGHDPAWYADVPTGDRSEWGIPPEAFTFICVANNRPFKDVPTLLRAAHLLDPLLPVHWLLVGQGMDCAAHRRLAADGPAAGRIHLAGFRRDTLRLMRACQAVVLPSRGGEGLNKTVMEGLFLGLPAVVTDLPGNRELVEQEVNGLIVPPRQPEALAQAMERLVRQKEVYQQLAAAAMPFMAARFHIKETIAQTLALYEARTGKPAPKA